MQHDEPAPERAFSPFAAGLAACYAVYPLAALYVFLQLPGRELAGIPLLAESLLASALAVGLIIRKPEWDNRLSVGVWFFLLLLFVEPWMLKLLYAWKAPGAERNAAPAGYALLAATREIVYFVVAVAAGLFLSHERAARDNAVRTPNGLSDDYFRRLMREPDGFRSLWLCSLPFGLLLLVCVNRAFFLWGIIQYHARYSLSSVDTILWVQAGGVLLFFAMLFPTYLLRRHAWLPLAVAACAGLAGLTLFDTLAWSKLPPADALYYLRRSLSPLAEGILIAGTAYMFSPGASAACYK